jgi:predicted GNAT family acetyltransferase
VADRRRQNDAATDEALDESFPASDPPANTVETGIRPTTPDAAPDVTDNSDASRLELRIGDAVAFLEYERTPTSFTIGHTEVPESLRGRKLGDALVRAALALSREHGLQTIVECPFARAFLKKHPDIVR